MGFLMPEQRYVRLDVTPFTPASRALTAEERRSDSVETFRQERAFIDREYAAGNVEYFPLERS